MQPASNDGWAALIALGAIVGVRILDWLLPKGWHLRVIERWGAKDDDEPTKEKNQ